MFLLKAGTAVLKGIGDVLVILSAITAGVGLIVGIYALVAAFFAWVIMLAVGAIAHEIGMLQYAIGFWPIFFGVGVLLVLKAMFSRSSKTN